MRRIDWLAGCLALVAGASGTYAAGCVIGNGETDCSTYPNSAKCAIATGTGASTSSSTSATSPTSSTTSSTTSTMGTGGMDSGPPPPPNCSGPPVAPTTVKGKTTGNILDECAVFVSPTSTAATPDGSMASPYKTLKDALGATTSSKNKVFACKSGAFSEAVTLSSEIEVYGGFDCTTDPTQWTWAAADRSEIDGPADGVALTIMAAADGALVSGFTIKGAAPSSATMGGSSIAVAVDDMPAKGVTIEQCDISAAAGAIGVVGAPAMGTPANGAERGDPPA